MKTARPALPLLITVDVEIAGDRLLCEQTDALWRLGAELSECPATWFCTARAAEQFAQPLRALVADGHEIGCHGLDHGNWKDYRVLSSSTALRTLREATDRIGAAVGVRPRTFRGPRMTTSAKTQDVLRQLGYLADFSVSARRFDFMTASCYEQRWSRTVGTPYRPSASDPFSSVGPARDGELVVVPLSGLGLPLCSGTLYLCGDQLARRIAKTLHRAAVAKRDPLVYLFHSYEFAAMRRGVDHRPMHHRLYPRSPAARYERNHRFLHYLRMSLPTRPLCAASYLEGLPDV